MTSSSLLVAGPSEERKSSVESALLAIAAYCSPTSSSAPHVAGLRGSPIEGFARACAVTVALQPVYSCGAAQALLPQMLKVGHRLSDWTVALLCSLLPVSCLAHSGPLLDTTEPHI